MCNGGVDRGVSKVGQADFSSSNRKTTPPDNEPLWCLLIIARRFTCPSTPKSLWQGECWTRPLRGMQGHTSILGTWLERRYRGKYLKKILTEALAVTHPYQCLAIASTGDIFSRAKVIHGFAQRLSSLQKERTKGARRQDDAKAGRAGELGQCSLGRGLRGSLCRCFRQAVAPVDSTFAHLLRV